MMLGSPRPAAAKRPPTTIGESAPSGVDDRMAPDEDEDEAELERLAPRMVRMQVASRAQRPPPMQAPPTPSSSGMRHKGTTPNDVSSIDADVYAWRLRELGLEIEQRAKLGRDSIGMLRRFRVRLAEWVEDVRSVGVLDALADPIAALLAQLAQLLVEPVTPAALEEIAVLGQKVTAFAASAMASMRPPSRPEFWK